MGQTTTGGTEVSYTNPEAAYEAGSYGAMAAEEASQLAQSSTSQAVDALDQQYQNASLAIQPYQQTGIQALDQLNQYLGLNPYTPSNAPIAPTAPTLASAEAQLAPGAVNQYILGNSLAGAYTTGAGTFPDETYIGGDGTSNGIGTSGNNGAAGPVVPGIIEAAGSPTTNPGNSPYWGVINPTIQADATNVLGQQQLSQDQSLYAIQQQAYTTNQANYNQDMQWAQQYATPLTSAQVTDNITNQPGYQAQLNQGIQAVEGNASANGLLASGGLLKQLMSYGQNTLNQYYGQTLSRLSSLAGTGASAANLSADQQIQQGNSLANLYTQLGTNQANAALAQGQALATAITAANPVFQTVGQQSSSGLGGLGSLLGGASSLLGSSGTATSAGSGLLGL